jgi:chemotaxis protein methyltransferase CheR
MIYFGQQEKQSVVDRIASVMPEGGILMIGHSESLNGLKTRFKLVQTAVYERIP